MEYMDPSCGQAHMFIMEFQKNAGDADSRRLTPWEALLANDGMSNVGVEHCVSDDERRIWKDKPGLTEMKGSKAELPFWRL